MTDLGCQNLGCHSFWLCCLPLQWCPSGMHHTTSCVLLLSNYGELEPETFQQMQKESDSKQLSYPFKPGIWFLLHKRRLVVKGICVFYIAGWSKHEEQTTCVQNNVALKPKQFTKEVPGAVLELGIIGMVRAVSVHAVGGSRGFGPRDSKRNG